MLQIRKLADRSGADGAHRFDPRTGEPLPNPPSWPLVGIKIEGDTPKACSVPTGWVARAKSEGWLTLKGERVVHRPGGPPENEWAITHTFVHADSLTLDTVDGPVVYRIVHQPDKYVDSGTDKTPVTPEVYAAGDTRVDHFYGIELEG